MEHIYSVSPSDWWSNRAHDCTVEDMLRHFVSPTMTNWDELLVHAQFEINNAWQESVQNTPFYLNHGRHPRTPFECLT